AAVHRPPGHADHAGARRGEGADPVHEPGHRRPVHLPLPHHGARGQRHDGRHRGGGMSMRQDAPYPNWSTTSRDDGARVEPPRDPETRPPETPEIEQPKQPARIAQPPREPRTEPPAEPSIVPPAEPQIEPPDRREGEEVEPERPAPPE